MCQPENRRELWADPPRTPAPAELIDRARADAQKVQSDLARTTNRTYAANVCDSDEQ